MSEVGFTNRQETRATDEIPRIGVGMLGYAFMGKAHSNAYRTLAYMTWPPPLVPELVAIAGRTQEAVAEAATRYGFADHVTDWKAIVADDRIGLFDNVGPNDLHAAPTIAAAEAGKHVICEKPLGRDADESYETWQRVQAAGVKHMCAFNYRFVPAVRLAREMIEAGELGEILHFRGSYLQEWGATDAAVWRFDRAVAGSGALGDLGAHVVDLARYLVGEIASVAARTHTFQPGREVDDAVESVVSFEGGAIGTIEASRFATGRKNAFTLGDQRLQGLAPLRSRAPQRARGPPDRLDAGVAGAGLPHRPRLGARPPVLGALVAAGPHDRMGAHLRARAAPPARGDPRRHAGRPARRDARGRLSRGRGLRRDAALIEQRSPRDGEVSLT